MDASTFRTHVESDVADELAALGSPRLLDALTGGDPTRRSVLAVAAGSEYAARETFRAWAGDADPRTRETFDDLVDQEARHYELVADLLDGYEPPDDAGPLHAYLRTREDPVERVGAGLVGRPLYTLQAHERLAAFFEGHEERTTGRTERTTNRDDRATAVIAQLRSDTARALDRGTTLLETLCTDGDDWERARATAAYAVTLAYDDYRDGLAATDQ